MIKYVSRNITSNEYQVILDFEFIKVRYCFKFKRKNLNIGTCYIYFGDEQFPTVVKFGLHAYGGKYPKPENTADWISICLGISRFKFRNILYHKIEDSILNSLFYDEFKDFDVCKPEQKKLWE